MAKQKHGKMSAVVKYGVELYVVWVALLLLCIPAAFFHQQLAVAQLIFSVCIIFATWVMRDRTKKNLLKVLQSISEQLDPTNRRALQNYPMPVLVTDAKRVCVWCNGRFEKGVFGGESPLGKRLEDLMDHVVFDGTQTPCFESETAYGEKRFSVYANYVAAENNQYYVYYFLDDTLLRDTYDEFQRTRPNVMLFVVDNYEELTDKERATEKTKVQLIVEQVLDRFISQTTGVMIRVRADRYLAVIEQQHLEQMIVSKFSVLDDLRTLVKETGVPITFSIGVGAGAQTMQEAEQLARGALDMAQGRGGDQAVIKDDTGYRFFGGVSQAIEKRTKVKTRIVAAAMQELIAACTKVIIMGHKNSDLDCIGAAVGLSGAIRRLARQVSIVVNPKTNLAYPITDRLAKLGGFESLFISVDEALDIIDHDTLLVVVDTHSLNMVESKELLQAAKTIAVIDHHRKMVDYISNAVMFYHEPYVSSTSEMVTELIQYFGEKCDIGRYEAEALLAGIMLDTKNFVMKTGVRTFEAAAYLRRRGADTVEVKKLFSGGMAAYKLRSYVVANATVHHHCAIAVVDKNYEGISIVAPQAADELLTISGVDASFVAYRKGDSINISGRSMGAVNVQVILEGLGGGGHHTMAGAQIKGSSMDDVIARLKEQIEEYSGKTL